MSGAFEIAFTVRLWWIAAYLAVGVVSFPVLHWWTLRRVEQHREFWTDLRWRLRQHRGWLYPVMAVVLWPANAWEAFR